MALPITGQEATYGNKVVARNALDLTQYIQTMKAGGSKTSAVEAADLLADHFGAQQSVAAVLVHVEQNTAERLNVREQQKAQDLVQGEDIGMDI